MTALILVAGATAGVLLFLLTTATANTALFARHFPLLLGLTGAVTILLAGLVAFQLHRLSLNTRAGGHFDLLVILRDDLDAAAVMETNHWMIAIGDHPYGDRTLPRFGCIRPELAAMSLEFVQELTVADRIRALAAAEPPPGTEPGGEAWR